MFYYSKAQFFINPPGCQFGVEFGSKWSPRTNLKSKDTGLRGSLKFVSILTRFLESKRTPNGYSKKWSRGNFWVLWNQVCPKAPRGSIRGPKSMFCDPPGVCFHGIFFVFKCMINVKFRFQALTSEHCLVAYQLLRESLLRDHVVRFLDIVP